MKKLFKNLFIYTSLILVSVAHADENQAQFNIGHKIPSLYNPFVSRGANFNAGDNIDTPPAQAKKRTEDKIPTSNVEMVKMKQAANAKKLKSDEEIWGGFNALDADDYNRRADEAIAQKNQIALDEQELRQAEAKDMLANIKATMAAGSSANNIGDDQATALLNTQGGAEALFDSLMADNEAATKAANQRILQYSKGMQNE